jgi:hypothetical protein
MLREASMAHEADWCEKTMSVLREKQYEACELRLSAVPSVGLFSPDATDAQAQELFEYSFYNGETDSLGLVTLASLRERVLKQLPVEALYLSRGESELLERLLAADGRISSDNWDEIDAAEALTRRLWCEFTDLEDEWTLELPQKLYDPLLLAFNNPQYGKAREMMFRYDATINGLLYITGFLHSDQPLSFFINDVMKRQDTLASNIAYRYMKANFEYLTDDGRTLILLHPGLADPKRLIATVVPQGDITLTLSEATLSGGINGILPEEVPLHERMRAELEGLTRPEWEADEAAEDLRLLAKQGVALDEMEAVLASMVVVLPTPCMSSALRQLFNCTPHWIGMNANLKH